MANEPENQSKQPPTSSNVGIFRKVVSHPLITASGYLIGVIGLCLTIASIRKPNLTYYISPTRTPIVQKGSLNNFSVTFIGNQVTGDLSSAEIQIWNQGKAPIRREDILKPITLRTQNGEPIYQINTKISRDVIGFNLFPMTNAPTGLLQMDWKILEQNDGARLQIIYGGGVNLPLIVDGVIEDQPQGLTQYEYDEGRIHNDKVSVTMIVQLICFLGVAILGALCFIYMEKQLTLWKKGRLLPYLPYIVLLMGVVAFFFAYGVVKLANIIVFPTKPPFGF